jgi:hypothetical protein
MVISVLEDLVEKTKMLGYYVVHDIMVMERIKEVLLLLHRWWNSGRL